MAVITWETPKCLPRQKQKNWHIHSILIASMDMGGKAVREGHGHGSILSQDIPVLQKEILNLGEPIILPDKEKPFLHADSAYSEEVYAT